MICDNCGKETNTIADVIKQPEGKELDVCYQCLMTIELDNERLISADLLRELKNVEWRGGRKYTGDECCPVCNELAELDGQGGNHLDTCTIDKTIKQAGGRDE